jgi:hypothetical protein
MELVDIGDRIDDELGIFGKVHEPIPLEKPRCPA